MNVHVTKLVGAQNGWLEFEIGPYDESRTWKGKFIDAAGNEIPGTEFELVSHTKHTAIGRLQTNTLPSQRAQLREVLR